MSQLLEMDCIKDRMKFGEPRNLEHLGALGLELISMREEVKSFPMSRTVTPCDLCVAFAFFFSLSVTTLCYCPS